MRRPLLLLLVLLAACGGEPVEPAATGPVRVRASVERSDVVPGQPFFLTVEVDRRQDVQIDLPDVGAGIDRLVIMDQRREGPETVGDRVVTRQIYKLKAPVEGTYLIPSVDAPWKTDANDVGTAGTGPILIEAARVGGAADEDEPLRDLKPLSRLDAQLWPWMVAAAFALLAVATVLLLRRFVGGAPSASPPPPPAHEVALAALRKLARSPLLREEDQGPFAYEVSAILRRYLEARFGFGAWRMTTPEVLRSMPVELASQREVEAAIRDVLEASDYVKFAGQPVPTPTLSGWVEAATRVVQRTQPRGEEAA